MIHKSGIYSITNKIDNKRYIGSAENLIIRWNEHKRDLNKKEHHNSHLQNAWNKYKEEAFIFEVLEYVENKNYLVQIEQYYLDWMETYKKDFGYNISRTAGSILGYRHTEESKKKISIANKNKIVSDETRKNMRHPKSFSHKEKIRLAKKNNRNAAKLTLRQVLEIREKYLMGYTTTQLKIIYNMSQPTIWNIVNYKSWIIK